MEISNDNFDLSSRSDSLYVLNLDNVEMTNDSDLREKLKSIIFNNGDEESSVCPYNLRELENSLDEMLELNDDCVLKASQFNSKDKSCNFNLPLSKNINESLLYINNIFSQIFQALQVLKNRFKCHEIEEPYKSSKRSKESHTRINRVLFELKQKINKGRVTISRLKVSPELNNLKVVAEKQVQGMLRTIAILLKCHLSYLPMAGNNLYPKYLDDILYEMCKVASFTDTLGYDVTMFQNSISKLKEADEKFHREQTIRALKNSKLSKNEQSKRRSINLIDNLAKERFQQKSPKKTNLKRSVQQNSLVILPKTNKITEDRSLAARAKRFGDTSLSQSSSIFLNEMVKNEQENLRRDGKLILDISDIELDFILKGRQSVLPMNPNRIVKQQTLIDELTEKTFNQIISDVCKELFNEKIIENLIFDELQI